MLAQTFGQAIAQNHCGPIILITKIVDGKDEICGYCRTMVDLIEYQQRNLGKVFQDVLGTLGSSQSLAGPQTARSLRRFCSTIFWDWLRTPKSAADRRLGSGFLAFAQLCLLKYHSLFLTTG